MTTLTKNMPTFKEAEAMIAVHEDTNPIPRQAATLIASKKYSNDIGYSDAFVEKHGARVRYIAEEGVWLIFDPVKGWHRDTTKEIENLFSEFARGLLKKAATDAQHLDIPVAERRLKEAVRLGDKKRIAPALQVALSNRKIVIQTTDLDTDPYLLGTKNGIVDLRDGSFRPPYPEVMVTRSVACEYDLKAKCPTFIRFLEEAHPDPEMRGYLKRLLGYSITGLNGEHILPFHYGLGGNGKGTFLEHTLLKLTGGYGLKVTNSFVYSNEHGHLPYNEIAGLQGVRFVLGEENDQGSRLNESLLKAVSGADVLKGRFLYKDFIQFQSISKVHLVGNHKPRIVGTDNGIWRRFRLIGWETSIPPEKQDSDLQRKLAQEFSGILNWLIEGAKEAIDTGTCPPQSIMAATEEFREDSDDFGLFLKEKTIRDEGATISKGALFAIYERYCDDNAIKPQFRKSKNSFGRLLKDRGYKEARRDEGERHWWEIRERRGNDPLPEGEL